MLKAIWRVGKAVAYFDRLLYEMVEILKRVFEPFNLWERDGHVNANFQKGITKLTGMPSSAASQPLMPQLRK
ncbi:hypothetical protein [Neorhizobium lilium]|uniref:hypothetical protein n=1 Tax=Neorhizobium lilium TaxID=2503024 RepID=UPI0013E34566|nr:hypothetical protein [Neorhizobium lilium]